MGLSTCSIVITQQSAKIITITRELCRSLQITGFKTITLGFGNKWASATLKIWNKEGSTLVIPQLLASVLYLPPTGNCMIKSDGRDLQLGPLIGILTGLTKQPNQPFGGMTSFIHEFMQSGSGKAFYFAFTPNHVDWKREVITGYIPGLNGRWVQRTFPLPDVVYNRLPSRKAESSTAMNAFKAKFVQRRIPLFNWSFFNKSDVYRMLSGETEASSYVPESINSPTAEEVKRLIEKHRFAYLKPTAGSLGIGIYRLTYTPQHGYYARFRRNSTNMLMRFPNFDGLIKHLYRQGVRLPNQIIQQGVRLIELDNCPIDFRFHMTKNGQNRWVPAGIGAKKAGRGSVTTHVRSGGILMMPEQVLSRIFGSKSEAVLNHAKEIAVRLAEAIERNYPHPLGELGFDLGIDLDERVWMFEANAKPGRSIFKHPPLKMQGKSTLVNLTEYCQYLSRFRTRRDG